MFRLLLTCTAPDDNNHHLQGEKSLPVTHKYMFILLHALSSLCLLNHLGNSFDMLVQYSDSQSQWRFCMLVPLRGVQQLSNQIGY